MTQLILGNKSPQVTMAAFTLGYRRLGTYLQCAQIDWAKFRHLSTRLKSFGRFEWVHLLFGKN